MKTIAIAAVLLTAMMIYGFRTSAVRIQSEEGIHFFSGTWQEALDKAKKENKSVFMDAFASWCGPCRMMRNKTFTDKEVADYYNEHFINVAMDMEKGEGPALSNKFSVEAYPTLIFVNGDGKLIKKTVGYHNPENFIALGKMVINGK